MNQKIEQLALLKTELESKLVRIEEFKLSI
jgi:hypothetical protein